MEPRFSRAGIFGCHRPAPAESRQKAIGPPPHVGAREGGPDLSGGTFPADMNAASMLDMAEHGVDEQPRDGAEELAVEAEATAKLERKRQYPLPERHGREHVLDEVCRRLAHSTSQAGWAEIATVVAHALATGAAEVEATADAERRWVDSLDNGLASFLSNPDCTPGYYNNEGRPLGRGSG